MNKIELSPKEIDVIISWFEYGKEDTQHYGDGVVTFPQEQVVLDKLNKGSSVKEFSNYEINLISDWMDESVNRSYGSTTVLIGDELSVYEKISALVKEIDYKNNHSRAS